MKSNCIILMEITTIPRSMFKKVLDHRPKNLILLPFGGPPLKPPTRNYISPPDPSSYNDRIFREAPTLHH